LLKLEVLELDLCRAIDDDALKAISRLRNLRLLSLRGPYEIESLSTLRLLQNLESLELDGCLGLRSYARLADLRKLVEIIAEDRLDFDQGHRVCEAGEAGLT